MASAFEIFELSECLNGSKVEALAYGIGEAATELAGWRNDPSASWPSSNTGDKAQEKDRLERELRYLRDVFPHADPQYAKQIALKITEWEAKLAAISYETELLEPDDPNTPYWVKCDGCGEVGKSASREPDLCPSCKLSDTSEYIQEAVYLD